MGVSKIAAKRRRNKDLQETYRLPEGVKPTRWGINKTATRTDYLKGVLWTIFSIYVRQRDCGMIPSKIPKQLLGKCITCARPLEWYEMQGGHYSPVAGSDLELCFDEENVNGECPACNADFNGWHLVPMRKNLVIKYGEAAVVNIEQRRAAKKAVKWYESDYVERIHHYYAQIKTFK